jgi:hypothetical protein
VTAGKGIMTELPEGCVRTTGAVVGDPAPAATPTERPASPEATMATARVGQKAPDFQTTAYYRGSFTTIKLSDMLGKWVLLCFYPGDFTFV